MSSTQVEKAKKHVEKNKDILKYVLVFSFGACLVMATRRPQIINVLAPVFHSSNYNISPLGGYLHKIVRCNETGQIWESVGAAADAVGVKPSNMSRHLNGGMDAINGHHFTIIGIGN